MWRGFHGAAADQPLPVSLWYQPWPWCWCWCWGPAWPRPGTSRARASATRTSTRASTPATSPPRPDKVKTEYLRHRHPAWLIIRTRESLHRHFVIIRLIIPKHFLRKHFLSTAVVVGPTADAGRLFLFVDGTIIYKCQSVIANNWVSSFCVMILISNGRPSSQQTVSAWRENISCFVEQLNKDFPLATQTFVLSQFFHQLY